MKKAGVNRRRFMRVGLTGTAAAALLSACESEPDEQAQDPGTFVLTRDHVLLSAAEIRTQAIGNTLVGTVQDGEGYELFLRPDGVAKLRMEYGRAEAGRWELRPNGEIVSRWSTIASGEELVSRYYVHPASGEYMNLATNGLRWSTFCIENGDSRGLDR